MADKYMGGFRAKDKGNIFCTNRRRAPLMALVFDALSFPMLIHQHGGWKQKANNNGQGAGAGMLDASELSQVYVNVKQFCDPFPACVLRE
jgi:hypothetical protein